MVTVETQRKAENESLLRSHETTEEADRRHGADHVAEESTSRGEGRDEHCHRRPAMSPRYSARQRSPPWKQRCDRNRLRQRTKGGENRAIGAVETQRKAAENRRAVALTSSLLPCVAKDEDLVGEQTRQRSTTHPDVCQRSAHRCCGDS